MIAVRIERQAVRADGERMVLLGEVHEAPVAVGGTAADGNPVALMPELENHRDAGGGLAFRGIKNVCGDHVRSLPSRRRVIFACSAAATFNSSAAGLRRRCSSAPSISSADLP